MAGADDEERKDTSMRHTRLIVVAMCLGLSASAAQAQDVRPVDVRLGAWDGRLRNPTSRTIWAMATTSTSASR